MHFVPGKTNPPMASEQASEALPMLHAIAKELKKSIRMADFVEVVDS